MEDGRVDNSYLKDYGELAVTANSSTAYTIDIENGNAFDITLTGNCTFTFSNPHSHGVLCSFTLFLTQDGTGSRTVAWPSSVIWPSETAPTLTTTASRTDVLTFTTVNGGSQWFGALVDANFTLA